jgi:hypothetical protein
MLQISNADQLNNIIDRCDALEKMWSLQEIKKEIDEQIDLDKKGQLKNKNMIQNINHFTIIQ